MEESSAILCEISYVKDILDQVNEEIEANIEITREIESETAKCTEFESSLFIRESHLTKSLYVSHFEINGLVSVADDLKKSFTILEEDLCSMHAKKDEMLNRINNKREEFKMQCLEFQRYIENDDDGELLKLSSKKEFLEKEIRLLDQNNDALKNSMLAFVDEVLCDLHHSNSALHVEIQNKIHENEKLLKDIDDLKTNLVSHFKCHNS